jgi:multidrug efflux pump subunit AcrA (membrane-fusion protein)
VAGADNDRVQALQNYTNVVAPLDGVVVWRYADTGALIQSGTNSNEQDIPIVRLSQSGLAAPAHADSRERRAVCPYRRPDAGSRRCNRPFFHGEDRALSRAT